MDNSYANFITVMRDTAFHPTAGGVPLRTWKWVDILQGERGSECTHMFFRRWVCLLTCEITQIIFPHVHTRFPPPSPHRSWQYCSAMGYYQGPNTPLFSPLTLMTMESNFQVSRTLLHISSAL